MSMMTSTPSSLFKMLDELFRRPGKHSTVRDDYDADHPVLQSRTPGHGCFHALLGGADGRSEDFTRIPAFPRPVLERMDIRLERVDQTGRFPSGEPGSKPGRPTI